MKRNDKAKGTKGARETGNLDFRMLLKELAPYFLEGNKRLHGDILSAEAFGVFDILQALFHAFHWIADDAMNIANGGRAKLDLTPKGAKGWAWVERRAKTLEKANTDFPKGVFNPCKELARWRKQLILLDKGAEARERGELSDDEKAELRGDALTEALLCHYLQDSVQVQMKAILTREGLAMAATIALEREKERTAKAEARAADAEAVMFKARGKAEAEAEARKRAEEARERAEEARRNLERLAGQLQGEGDTWRRVAEGQGAEILAETKKGTVAAQRAEQAAIGAADAVKESKRGMGVYYGLVALFRKLDPDANGRRISKGDWVTAIEDARGAGSIPRTMTKATIRNKRTLWLRHGGPDAPEFAKICKADKHTAKARRGKG